MSRTRVHDQGNKILCLTSASTLVGTLIREVKKEEVEKVPDSPLLQQGQRKLNDLQRQKEMMAAQLRLVVLPGK